VFAECIANSMGKFVGIDEDNLVRMDKSLNFMADIDITKPLHRVIRVKVCGAPVWFDVKYVRLSELCYACGMLGHIYRGCELYDDSVPETSLPYGPNLRAYPIKNNRHGRETEKQEEQQLLQAFRESRKIRKIKTKLIFDNPIATDTTSMMNIDDTNIVSTGSEMFKRKTPEDAVVREEDRRAKIKDEKVVGASTKIEGAVVAQQPRRGQ